MLGLWAWASFIPAYRCMAPSTHTVDIRSRIRGSLRWHHAAPSWNWAIIFIIANRFIWATHSLRATRWIALSTNWAGSLPGIAITWPRTIAIISRIQCHAYCAANIYPAGSIVWPTLLAACPFCIAVCRPNGCRPSRRRGRSIQMSRGWQQLKAELPWWLERNKRTQRRDGSLSF